MSRVEAPEPSRKEALAWSLALSALFLLVYGACNAITAGRSAVGAIHGAWERRVPFVPAFIFPYMSIDLFFVAAPFLCRRRGELVTHARRVGFATLFAGACFLLFPLRFAFERPAVGGAAGILVGLLDSFDEPHNLFPSLHLAYLVLLWGVYARNTRGPLRASVLGWFVLVGASPLLTYQHHLADVAGGVGLGLATLRLFPRDAGESASHANGKLGGAYALGAAACLAGAFLLGGWARVLLWPSVSLGLVAAGYAGAGHEVFHKRRGRLSLATRLVLGPYLLASRLVRRFFRADSLPWSAIDAGVLLGPALRAREAEAAVGAGVTAVLDAAAEIPECAPFRALPYASVALLDFAAPREEALRKAAEFLRAHEGRGKVYAHCALGYSRSALCVAAWLLSTGRARTAGEAVEFLRGRRPGVRIGAAGRSALEALERKGAGRSLPAGADLA